MSSYLERHLRVSNGVGSMGDLQEFMKGCGMETTLVPGHLWILEERWRVHPGLCSLLLQCGKNIPSGGKETPCNAKRPRFNLRVGKIPWRRKWQPTPVFLLGEFHGQRSLAGYSPWGHKESDSTK